MQLIVMFIIAALVVAFSFQFDQWKFYNNQKNHQTKKSNKEK